MRLCPVCGAELVRRTKESAWNFAARKTCGYVCASLSREATKATMRAAADPVQRPSCSEDGCDTPAIKRGMCGRCYQRHYNSQRRRTDPRYGLPNKTPATAPVAAPPEVWVRVQCGVCGQRLGLAPEARPWRIYDRHNCPRKGKR